MWFHNSVFYQIYPFGFCGAPKRNDGVVVNRIHKVADWIPHMKAIGVNALYLCPIFESELHGYDTCDYKRLDARLGSNDDFKAVCDHLHREGIKIVIDGVFNHVGRGFWAFLDVIEKREHSAYKDWFYVDFASDSDHHDGFYYEGWEGDYNLVKLNLQNEQVVSYLLECIQEWIYTFDIDGLRLDVAYLLDASFLKRIHEVCKRIKSDFFLLGEMIHGDYKRIVNEGMLDSSTNYECFKGIYSSLNDMNLFEIAYSLHRQFGSEGLYKGLSLFNFVDNHDVNRIASNLKDVHHIKAAYMLLFTIPGIPCVYYGSEWGATGMKQSNSDDELRPCFEDVIESDLTTWISKLAYLRQHQEALQFTNYEQVYLTNRQFIYKRIYKDTTIMVVMNIEGVNHQVNLPLQAHFIDLIDGNTFECDQSLVMTPYSVNIYQVINR